MDTPIVQTKFHISVRVKDKVNHRGLLYRLVVKASEGILEGKTI